MTMILRTLLSALLVLLSMPAFAVYKCEAGSKVTYSDTPCAGGQIIDVDNTASDNGAQNRHELARQKAELKRLESMRHKQEAQQAKLRRTAARAEAAKQKKCDSLARRKKWADEDAAAAAGKSVEKARRKAQRAREKYEDECGS